MNPTLPSPTDYPNKPWSLPPCANPSPEGLACTLHAHTIRDGVRTHGAQVKDPFIRWETWRTEDS